MKPNTHSPDHLIKTLQQENERLKIQLADTRTSLHSMQQQYQALEEDFLHALHGNTTPDLAGKKIVYIGGYAPWKRQYKDIAKEYKGQLIVPDDNNLEAINQAIEAADEVICPQDCPNKALCDVAKFRCLQLNKSLRPVANNSPQSLQQELSYIAVEIQSTRND